MPDLAPRWLDPDDAARYIGVRVEDLPRLVKAGKVPTPSRWLGPRQPRYDRLALDKMFAAGAASEEIGETVDDVVRQIEEEAQSGADRPHGPRRRDGEGVPIRGVPAQA